MATEDPGQSWRLQVLNRVFIVALIAID